MLHKKETRIVFPALRWSVGRRVSYVRGAMLLVKYLPVSVLISKLPIVVF